MSMSMMLKTVRDRQPFSLIELMVLTLSAVIVGAGIYVSARNNPDSNTRIQARVQDEMRGIYTYLNNRRQQQGTPLPNTEEGLESLVNAEGVNGVLVNIPFDPWGRPYQYRYPGKRNAMDLFSLGPDGVESQDDIFFGMR